MISRPYEVIVIGSGATGGMAALTLAEAGTRVLVVEAGPELSVQKALGSEPINTFQRVRGVIVGEKRIQAQHPGYWKANPLLYANEIENPYKFPEDKPFFWTQGKQVGGRSLTWGGITLRLSDNELKASTKDGYGTNWPINYSELAPHYSAIEKRLEVHGQKDGLDQLPDGDYIRGPLPFTKVEELFGEKVKSSLGHPFIHSRGFGPHRPNILNPWPRSSSPGSTLKSAIATGKVEILSEHMVERIIFNKSLDLADGVIVVNQCDGSRKKLKASLIVLCASTIQSLRILLNSEKNSNSFVNQSGKLGCNLMDHISISRFFAIPKKQNDNSVDIKSGKQILSGAGSFFIPFGTKFLNTSTPNFIRGYGIWGGIDRFEPPDFLKRIPDSKTGFLIGHGEVLPSQENKVTLSNEIDRWGIPLPHINCAWGKNEKAMADHMAKTIKEIIEVSGGIMLPINQLFKIPLMETFLENAVALKDEAPPPGYYIHEVGGAPMGENAEDSVLDRFNRLWQCQNVLVVDGSCWPSSGWQSPTLTMMAITRRACKKALSHSSE